MMNNPAAHPRSPSLPWLAVSYGAAALVAASCGILWLLSAAGPASQLLLAAAILTPLAVLGFVWLIRLRSTRRLSAILDIYAEREIARSRRLPAQRHSMERNRKVRPT
jgi:hypothetical protein